MADETEKKTSQTRDTVILNESIERRHELPATSRKEEPEKKKDDSKK